MIVIVSGSRDYHKTDILDDLMDLDFGFFDELGIFVGDAKGVDATIREFCITKGVEHEIFYADWESYGFAAGPIRNKQMIEAAYKFHQESGDEIVMLAFPGPKSKGTKNAIEIAQKMGINVLVREVY